MKKIKLVYGILLIAIIAISGCEVKSGPTGNVPTTCPTYKCVLTSDVASFESKILDDKGNGCLTDCVADIRVKNLENQPTGVSVSANCNTINKQGTYTSKTFWMQPNSEHDFRIKVDAGLTENWRCENFVVNSDKISACQLQAIS